MADKKLLALDSLDLIAKTLYERNKGLIRSESDRAIAKENALLDNINSVREMLGGKALRYVTQAEYDELTEEELNDDAVVYFVTDAADMSHEHANQEFLDGLNQEVLDAKQDKEDQNLLTENKTIVGAINELQILSEELDTDIFNATAKTIELEIYKADKEYVDNKLSTMDAITLNGYSIWVGTAEELEQIVERDPNTLYFEISDESTGEDVVQVDVVNGVLQLTADKYQKTNMVDGTEIIFPSVNLFTEIHLYFAADSNMNISLPDNCKWRVEPNIEEGNYYEIVAVYNTMFWLVNVISYSDEYSDDTDSNKIIWYDNKEIRSGNGQEIADETKMVSDFISLEDNKDYQMTVLNNTDSEIYCYDNEKNYLSDLDVSVSNYGFRIYSLRKMFEMDDMDISNTKYIRIETTKNEYINATNVNEKIIIEEIDTLEDNQVPLIILDNCRISSNGARSSDSDFISIQYIVLDNYFNYQFEFLGSDTTVNFYDEGENFISRDRGENDDHFEGRQVVLDSDDFPEGTKYVRIRFMKNDTITFENIHEHLKVTKTPVVSENIIPLNWIENTSLDSTNGQPKSSDARAITDFIEIDDSYYYTITLDEPDDVKEYYYNSNKEFISRSSSNDISTGNEVLEFPEGTKYIRLKSDTDEHTIDIVKEKITLKKFLKKENFLYSFGLLSDVHIDNNYDADYSDKAMSDEDYRNALRFLEDEGVNFIAYCGDMTTNNRNAEADYQMLAECLKESHVPNYIIKGNHDAGQGYFDEYVSETSRFTVPYKDDLFIFVGNGSNTGTNAGMTQSRIDYIRGIIEDNPDRRLFLMYHQFIRGYGSGDGTGGLYSGRTIGDDPNNALTNEFIELVTSTPNLIFCHGHSHIRFNVQDTCPTANYYHVDGECHNIHVPSCARPRIINESGSLESYYEGSEGYKVDVYSDKVIFKAIDFTTNSYMPEYNQVVNLAAVAAEYDSIPNPTLYIDTENGSIAADGTIQDISGNNYPITAYNTSILDDGAIAFNIDNKSYLECGLDPNDSCWTAEIYFRLTDIIEQDMNIFSWGTSENKFTTQYDWDKYSLDFKYGVDIEKDNFNEYIDYDTNTDFTNKFVHIMYSCDGDSVVININGKTVITCDTTPMTEIAKNIIIGKHYVNDEEYANMELKLFRFYNGVALNRYQMQCNYLNLIRG